ncbi:MAG: hypothetical protein JSR18_15960 [Proteobacteria bacterium]|nr:hypothetical protein [Pseudomonadota bacterium]
MAHLLDPSRLDSESAYASALDELESLLLSDPDTPAGRRFDELVALIEDYEARHWPAELPGRLPPQAHDPAALYGPL